MDVRLEGPEEPPLGEDVPGILVCGPHRAGKSSILKVVFQKMSPHETLFLEATSEVVQMDVQRNPIVKFRCHDCPGSVTDQQLRQKLEKCKIVVFVIDAQDEPYEAAIKDAKRVLDATKKINKKIGFEILIHKVDGDQFFSEDHKTDIKREIHSKLSEDKSEADDVSFHCTSIYDHTIWEAFSRIVQKLIPLQLPTLIHCLDSLTNNSRMEKAYLFDVSNKVYLASDSQPVDLQSYELCSDMIDVVIDVSCIYGYPPNPNNPHSDEKSSCVIHLSNERLLYLREVDRCLALVCIMREENFDRQHLLDHNIKLFKEALDEIFAVDDSEKGDDAPAAAASS